MGQEAPPPPPPQDDRFLDYYEAIFEEAPEVFELETDHYQISPQFITMIQQGSIFQGLATEDPEAHIHNFISLCSTFKLPGITKDATKKLLFPFSLRGQASTWYRAVEGHTIETFEEIQKLFMVKYFSPDTMNKLRLELFQFQQFDRESYTKVWERFQKLLRWCPSSLLLQGNPIYNFFNGLMEETQAMLNANAGGQLMEKSSTDVHELCKRVAK